MICFLYLGSYLNFNPAVDAQNWKSAHQLHAAMYALADKYDLTIINDTAPANFNKLVAMPQHLLGFLESIASVYLSTPNSNRFLRDAALKTVATDCSHLPHKDAKESFQGVLLEVPNFSWDFNSGRRM